MTILERKKEHMRKLAEAYRLALANGSVRKVISLPSKELKCPT